MTTKTSFGLTVAPNQVGHEFTWVTDERHTDLSVTSDTTKDGLLEHKSSLKIDAALDTVVDVRQLNDWNPEV